MTYVPAAAPSPLKGSDEFVEAFAKGLLVIGAFNDGSQLLSMADVAERAQLTRAGARRLLYTLVRLNYATVEDGRFRLTPRILELGRAYLSSFTNYDRFHQFVESLAFETQELCTMSVLDGSEVVYVARVEGRPALTRSLTVGSRLPAFATSMGRILLASKPDHEIRNILESAPRPAFTRHTRTDVEKIMTEIQKARRNGWSLVKQELEIGVCGLSAPARNISGSGSGAISISFNMARFDERKAIDHFLPILLNTVSRISAPILVASSSGMKRPRRRSDTSRTGRSTTG